jgi:nucleotide-binding universal stress UspA family protein
MQTRPLLLLRPSLETPALDIDRVVVALDGSPLAEQALVPACDLARSLALPLELLHVVDPLQPTFAAGAAGYGRIQRILEQSAETYLAEVAARERGPGLTVETLRLNGAPAEVIAQHLQAHPQSLLVIGTHGRGGWRATIIGSVARRVVLLASAPILLVHATPPAA